MSEQSNTYAYHYQKLRQINDKLQQGQNNPDLIDELAELIEQASQSYKFCSERIKAAEKVLEKHQNTSDDPDTPEHD
jgi:exodeoxyribonuclease VII small subunit